MLNLLKQGEAIDQLLATFDDVVRRHAELIRTINNGSTFQRSSIVDITAETMRDATEICEALQEGRRLLLKARLMLDS